MATLPRLIPDPAERALAIDLCEQIAGPIEEMSPPTVVMLEDFKSIFNVTDEKTAA